VQVLWHETELVAGGEGLVMSENDDGRRLRCVATVDGLLSNVTVTTVAVRCQSHYSHFHYLLTIYTAPLKLRHCGALEISVLLLLRAAWVKRSRPSVRLSICLFVRRTTQKRMIPKCSNLV